LKLGGPHGGNWWPRKTEEVQGVRKVVPWAPKNYKNVPKNVKKPPPAPGAIQVPQEDWGPATMPLPVRHEPKLEAMLAKPGKLGKPILELEVMATTHDVSHACTNHMRAIH
jgi:hypothetical protein